MKLPLNLLQKFVDLPTKDLNELRRIFDDLGLEVKSVEESGAGAFFTIETLANRGDHLHVVGLAREISARYLSPLKLPSFASELPDRRASVPVKNNTDKCFRYSVMEMNLPERMELRSDISNYLESESEKDKHPIVDILNYVLLEIGQPMHAFDRDKVDGEINIELSSKIEEIEALDGKKYEVPAGSILICDKKKIIAVGGVIGCANSMVTTQTKRVLIESAIFDPISVRKTARGMGLSTDACQLFEKGSDPENVIQGLKRALYLASSSGAASNDTSAAHVLGLTIVEGPPISRPQIDLDLGMIRRQVNLPRLEAVELTARLKNLGFQVVNNEDGKTFKVTVPSWRIWDVENSDDLLEEFARVLGYSKVKQELPALDYHSPEPNEIEALLMRIEPALIGYGFHEVITKGFYSAADVSLLQSLDQGIEKRHLSVINSVESNYSHMKITNILHLARLAEANHRKGIQAIKVYELGRLFTSEMQKSGPYQFERDAVTLAASGRWSEHEWRKPELRDQFAYSFKGVVEALVESIGCELVIAESKDPLLHPGYQAAIKAGKTICGFFGLIHPKIKDELELSNDLFYAELDAQALIGSIQSAVYKASSEFPAVRRDLTLKLGSDSLADNVRRKISDSKVESLNSVDVVDNFVKDGEDFRRVTFRLTFQALERTLEAAEVDRSVEQVLANLHDKHGIELV